MIGAQPQADVLAVLAVITGVSRGIGAATALVLAERGFRVVVNHRASAPQAEEVVAARTAAGGEAVAIWADVTAPGDVAGMVGRSISGGMARSADGRGQLAMTVSVAQAHA